MLKIGRTETFLNVIDQKFYEKEYSEYGVNEELKAKDPMAWIQRYNQVRAQIKERLQQEMEDFCAGNVNLFKEARNDK